MQQRYLDAASCFNAVLGFISRYRTDLKFYQTQLRFRPGPAYKLSESGHSKPLTDRLVRLRAGIAGK